MSRPLKPGDAVLVIGGPRRGEVTTVVSGPRPFHNSSGRSTDGAMVNGDVVYQIALSSRVGDCRVVAWPRDLLPLHDPDKTAEYLAELNVPAESEVCE